MFIKKVAILIILIFLLFGCAKMKFVSEFNKEYEKQIDHLSVTVHSPDLDKHFDDGQREESKLLFSEHLQYDLIKSLEDENLLVDEFKPVNYQEINEDETEFLEPDAILRIKENQVTVSIEGIQNIKSLDRLSLECNLVDNDRNITVWMGTVDTGGVAVNSDITKVLAEMIKIKLQDDGFLD